MAKKVKNRSAQDAIFIGVDDGFYETKVAIGEDDCFSVPSRAKSGEDRQISITGSTKPTIFTYDTPDGPFSTGALRAHDSTAFDTYPFSTMNRVLVMHALREAGVPEGANISICTGLPIKRFYLGAAMDQQCIKKKRDNLLLNDVRTRDGFELPVVKNHTVVAEGIAAWLNLVLQRNKDGILEKDSETVEKRICFIDIGGRTTDVAVIQNGILDAERSITVELGMLSVGEIVREKIVETYKIEPTSLQLESATTEGSITIWGEEHSTNDICQAAKKTVASSIEAVVRKTIGSAADIDRVRFVGGSVAALGDLVNDWFPHQEISENPSFENALGMRKFAEMMLSINHAQ
jgi:plasmid segregation protein ParM